MSPFLPRGPLSDLPSEGLRRWWPLSHGAGRLALGSALADPALRSPLHLAVAATDHVRMRQQLAPLPRSSPSVICHATPSRDTTSGHASCKCLPRSGGGLSLQLPTAKAHLLWAELCGPPCSEDHGPRWTSPALLATKPEGQLSLVPASGQGLGRLTVQPPSILTRPLTWPPLQTLNRNH